MANSILGGLDSFIVVITTVKDKVMGTTLYLPTGDYKCADPDVVAFLGNAKIMLNKAMASGTIDNWQSLCTDFIAKGIPGI